LCAALCSTLISATGYAQVTSHNAQASSPQLYKPTSEKVLVRWNNQIARSSRVAPAGFTVKKTFKHLNNVQVVEIPSGKSVKEAVLEYQKMPGVALVEPDYRVHSQLTPSDPDFNQLWGLHNTSNTDINAPQAWDLTTGSSNVVVAVIDSGVDYNHPDLAANMWQNPGEIANNGIDDDGNGYIDDVYGIDTANSDADPLDDNEHGTHVAGTIAAVMNNDKGIVGVAPQTKIVACKFLDSFGGGDTSAAIECLDYLYDLKVNHGVNLVATNNSWGGGGSSQILKEAIERHDQEGILFIAAAGNSGQNIDQVPDYPAGYDVDNIISVAAIDENDQLAYFSNYGERNVDIAAPGVNIYSTIPNGLYGSMDGTSMAAPHVTGAVALLAAHFPNETADTYTRLITKLGIQVPSLNGKVAGGQRLVLWGENQDGPLNCENQLNISLIEPASNSGRIQTSPGAELTFKVAVHECGVPVTGQSFTAIMDGQNLAELVDDGTNGDEAADDGIYTATVEIDFLGEATVTFSGGIDNQLVVWSQPTPSITEVAYSYVDFQGTALNQSDDSTRVLNPGFTLQLPWGAADTLYVSSNGVISAGESNSSYSNRSLPAPEFSHALMLFWDDLYPGNGDVYYEVIGQAPNRQLVIEYRDYSFCCSAPASNEEALDFQVVMYENRSELLINYKDMDFPSSVARGQGSSATVGYQYNDSAVMLSHNQAVIQSRTSYRITLGDFSDYPEVTRLATTGLFRPGYPVSFEIEGSSPTEEAINLSIEFGDGTSQILDGASVVTEHVYEEAGQYDAVVRVDAAGKTTYRTLLVEVLPFTDTEQAILDELIGNVQAAPEDYGLISIEDHQTAVDTAIADTITQVTEMPGDYGLISNEDHQTAVDVAIDNTITLITESPESYGLVDASTLEPVTADVVDALAEGTHLLGSSEAITDLAAVFSNARLVWVYNEEQGFLGWSADAELRTKIENSGYGRLQAIEAGAGFWVKK
jgi:hypothetical protein